jgi:hypothetical protein
MVRVRLVFDKNEIRTELESPDLENEFNEDDVKYFKETEGEQKKAADNTADKTKNLPISGGQRIHAKDYNREPVYPHAGIHLHARQGDQIEWFSNQRLNFMIEVGPDPQLFLLPRALGPNEDPLSIADLHAKAYNPFEEDDPLIVVSGRPVRSGRLKLHNGELLNTIKNQRYYKFSVTLMGTGITLDPHYEGHDD